MVPSDVVDCLATLIEAVDVSPQFKRTTRYDSEAIPQHSGALRRFSVFPMGQVGKSLHMGETLWRHEKRAYDIVIAYPTGYQTEDLAKLVEDDEGRVTYALVDSDNWVTGLYGVTKTGSNLDRRDLKCWFRHIEVEAYLHYGRP